MYLLCNGEEIIEYPYSIKKLKQDNPTVSFPSHLSDELLASYGVYFVNPSEVPEHDANTHNCVWDSSPTLTDGSWMIGASIVEKTQEEKDEIVSQTASLVRDQRSRLLSNSDWTQLADSQLTDTQKASWATYRQQLRDISDQDGFPLSVDWPVHGG